MRKRSLWLAIFVFTIVGVLVSWGWQRYVQPTSQAVVMHDQHLAQRQTVTAPKVNSQRLLSDLEMLSFKRYSAADRDRARQYILKSLEDAGWTPQQQSFDSGINIYAERSGSDPNAGTILVAAHYDTVEQSPGVDDNATSVATVLEIARLFAQQPMQRTLQVVFFDQEEEGAVGSQVFVDRLPTQTLQGAIVMDMLGYACHDKGCQSYPPVLPVKPPTDRGDFLAVIGDRGHQPLIDSFAQSGQSKLPQVLSLAVPTFGGLAPDLVRSDHAPFWKKGLGAVLVTDTANFRNPNYHKSSDTLDTIDRDFFVGSAQVVVNATATLLHSQADLVTASLLTTQP
jgi:hypothetical protein